MKIATWNINSVRLRAPLIAKLAAEYQPDIICLQETKTEDVHFPRDAMEAAGYSHMLFSGQKGYNGVAILSKYPLEPLPVQDMTGDGAKRDIAAIVDGRFHLYNFYMPAGGDEPDPEINPKFRNKLAYLDQAITWIADIATSKAVLVGDFNIAPYDNDVWSHKQLLKVVCHTPIEIELLNALKDAGQCIDVAREFVDETEKCYSWWSYRNRDWRKSNRGRRLDHIWVTQGLRDKLAGFDVVVDARDWPQPSDHVPVMMTLEGV